MFYSFLRIEATEYPKHANVHPILMGITKLIPIPIAIINPITTPTETMHYIFINSRISLYSI